MKVKAIITEKSMGAAKKGRYTFAVPKNLNKFQIRKLIEKVFGVHTTSIKTLNLPSIIKKNYQGRKINVAGFKKAIVTLKEKEKIDLFETKGGK